MLLLENQTHQAKPRIKNHHVTLREGIIYIMKSISNDLCDNKYKNFLIA